MNLFRKQFDSLTDYILYFSSFGIGFSFGEDALRFCTSGSIVIFNQGLADKLYNSIYGSTAVSTFTMSLLGAACFLYTNRRALKIKGVFLSSLLISLYTFSTLLSCLPTFVKSFSNPHIYSWIYFIPVTAQEITQNISLVIVSFLLAMCVIYDFYILNNFTDAIILCDKTQRESTDLNQIREFYRIVRIYKNPINYIASMHPSVCKFIGFEKEKSISRTELTNYSKNALLYWKSNDKESIVLKQYNIIIQE